MSRISHLPPELLSQILHYLPLRSLLAFGSTNSHSYVSALSCLDSLDIGIHPSRQAALLAEPHNTYDFSDDFSNDSTAKTNIILPQRRCKTLFLTILHQNELATDILNSHGPSLRSLDLSIWDLRMETSTALSKASRLRHLTLRMDHPHARVSGMPAEFWHESPGSTVWNKLYAAPKHYFPITPPASPHSSRCPSPELGMIKAVFTQLRTLHLERAGITDYQLQRIIGENPELREIRLRRCLTLTDEFFHDLAASEICSPRKTMRKKGLKLLHFEMSTRAEIDYRILHYIRLMSGLESLSLAGCTNLTNHQVREMNDAEWTISDLTLPHSEDSLSACDIEIDPSYLY